MKYFADLGGCYPPRPSASVDNTLFDLQNSSYPSQPHAVIKSNECWWQCQNRNKCLDVSGLCPSSANLRTQTYFRLSVTAGNTSAFVGYSSAECSLSVAPRFQVLNLKVALYTRAPISNEVKTSIEAAWLACPEKKDETHFLPLPLFVPIAECDPADQCVGCGMSVRTEQW